MKLFITTTRSHNKLARYSSLEEYSRQITY